MNAEQVRIVGDVTTMTTTMFALDELKFVDEDISEAFKGCAYPHG